MGYGGYPLPLSRKSDFVFAFESSLETGHPWHILLHIIGDVLNFQVKPPVNCKPTDRLIVLCGGFPIKIGDVFVINIVLVDKLDTVIGYPRYVWLCWLFVLGMNLCYCIGLIVRWLAAGQLLHNTLWLLGWFGSILHILINWHAMLAGAARFYPKHVRGNFLHLQLFSI